MKICTLHSRRSLLTVKQTVKQVKKVNSKQTIQLHANLSSVTVCHLLPTWHALMHKSWNNYTSCFTYGIRRCFSLTERFVWYSNIFCCYKLLLRKNFVQLIKFRAFRHLHYRNFAPHWRLSRSNLTYCFATKVTILITVCLSQLCTLHCRKNRHATKLLMVLISQTPQQKTVKLLLKQYRRNQIINKIPYSKYL